MPKPEHIRVYHETLVNEAKTNCNKSAADHSYSDADVVGEISRLMHWDAERERLKAAKEILDGVSKPGGTSPGGLLVLMGDRYAYEPNRMIRFGEGRVVENENKLLPAAMEHAGRVRQHANEAQAQANREQRANEHFAIWALKEQAKGRPVLELTWGNCVKESGLLHDVAEAAA